MQIDLLDVNLALDRATYFSKLRITRLQYVQKAEQTQITAYNGLQSLIENFQTQLNGLNTVFNTDMFTATSSNKDIATASVINSNLSAGQHTLKVNVLARAETQASDVNLTTRTGSANINGTLTLTNKNNEFDTFSVTIANTDSLENIRDKINNSIDNSGIKASIVNTTDDNGNTKFVLVLTGKSGTANEFDITGSAAPSFAFQTKQTALDADITLDDFHLVRSSNVIDDAIDGLSLTLNDLGTSTINVNSNATDNNAKFKTAFNKMLSAYNQVITYLDANQYVTIYDEKNEGNTASTNNNTFQFIKSQLQSAINTVVSGAGDLTGLSDMGIKYSAAQQVADQFDSQKTINSFGSLEIDLTAQNYYNSKTKFDWELENNFSNLQKYFQGANGFISNVSKVLKDSILKKDESGMITSSLSLINKQVGDTADKINVEMWKMNNLRTTLVNQYATINANLQRLQNESEFLTKQYDYLNSLMRSK